MDWCSDRTWLSYSAKHVGLIWTVVYVPIQLFVVLTDLKTQRRLFLRWPDWCEWTRLLCAMFPKQLRWGGPPALVSQQVPLERSKQLQTCAGYSIATQCCWCDMTTFICKRRIGCLQPFACAYTIYWSITSLSSHSVISVHLNRPELCSLWKIKFQQKLRRKKFWHGVLVSLEGCCSPASCSPLALAAAD